MQYELIIGIVIYSNETNNIIFKLLLLILNIFKIPRVYSVNGQTIFISDTRYENKGYFVYALDLKREKGFLKFNTFNQITIFFTIDKCYLIIFFQKWNNNNQLLIDQNINANTYLIKWYW